MTVAGSRLSAVTFCEAITKRQTLGLQWNRRSATTDLKIFKTRIERQIFVLEEIGTCR